MVKRYDPTFNIGDDIDTEDDRVNFITGELALRQAITRGPFTLLLIGRNQSADAAEGEGKIELQKALCCGW